MLTKKYLKDLVYKVNGAAISVHKEIGPGLLESVYHRCLHLELTDRNIHFKSELKIPFAYKGVAMDIDLRCDFLIENKLVVEIKALKEILPVHEAQLMSYMKLLQVPIGLLINFNVTNIYYYGQATYVNELYKTLPEF